MEIILQEVAAKMSSVPVIDGEELGFHSLLLDVQSYADSVLVVVSDYSLVGVHSISFYRPVFLN